MKSLECKVHIFFYKELQHVKQKKIFSPQRERKKMNPIVMNCAYFLSQLSKISSDIYTKKPSQQVTWILQVFLVICKQILGITKYSSE